MSSLATVLKKKAFELGFEVFGVSSAIQDKEGYQYLQNWLSKKSHGNMDYMEKTAKKRAFPQEHDQRFKTVVLLGKNYQKESDYRQNDYQIASYAKEEDYHIHLKQKIKELLESMPKNSNNREFVDSFPILERSFAQIAGLGFIGKNTTLINEKLGSYFFISGFLTDQDLEPTTNTHLGSCGTCTLCLDACPTKAFEKPYYLNASKCISYLTIEHKGQISQELREQMGSWLFGCDICQDVCPHNRSKSNRKLPLNHKLPTLEEIFRIPSNKSFERKFEGLSLLRPRRKGLLRNACIVAGNSKNKKWIPDLKERLLNEKNDIIRESSAWALGQIPSKECLTILLKARKFEESDIVIQTIEKSIAKHHLQSSYQD